MKNLGGHQRRANSGALQKKSKKICILQENDLFLHNKIKIK